MMFKKIWNTLGDNWLIVIAAVVALAVARMSEAQTVDPLQHCQDEQRADGAIIAEDVAVTGDNWPLTLENGQTAIIPGSAITFTFADGAISPDLGPDHIKADHVLSTILWLNAPNSFGVKRQDGALWVMVANDNQCQAYVVTR